ncbi:MAG: glycosyltransferase family 2 protein [Bacteroidia bacterium]
MDLSVIIVNYNVKHLLERCIRTTIKASQKLDVELIVVDNNSQDGSQAMVREKFANEVVLIENHDNPGFSKANNQGIAIAKGRYVLLLNPDTVVAEDTFERCFDFMEKHPDAGGLGIRMIDGDGKFLPESKRGLPRPWVAFYKIFGLARIFPKNKTFGKYHLSYLDEHETHEVDVLSGAYMWMRKSVLDEIGGLDETFFMYGEDIDLSYRIQLGGYKNYYLHDARIIHYKGESTKKGSLNYVKVFYQAMIIFAKKHFQGGSGLFTLMIRFAVYARAFLAIVKRLAQRLALPVLEGGLMYAVMFGIKEYWEHYVKFIESGNEYPPEFSKFYMPAYTLVFVLCFWLAGAYRRPFRVKPLIVAPVAGFFLIATITYIFPFVLNFSRAIVGLSAVFSSSLGFGLRGLINWREKGSFFFTEPKQQRAVVFGNDGAGARLLNLISKKLGYQREVIGTVGNEPEALGSAEQLEDVLKAYQAREVIFAGESEAINSIFDRMEALGKRGVGLKIAPEGMEAIIGPQAVVAAGEESSRTGLSIHQQRQKRNFDLVASSLFLVLTPFLFPFYKNKKQALSGLWQVFSGKKSMVSAEKDGLLSVDLLAKDKVSPDPLRDFYMSHYQWMMDAEIVFRNWRSIHD